MTREDGTTYKLYWAKSNLSTSGLCANPKEYGDYYAWGGTEPKIEYSVSTDEWGSDDAAREVLGGKWRIPTDAEWTALSGQ